jgi:hypothetical protein
VNGGSEGAFSVTGVIDDAPDASPSVTVIGLSYVPGPTIVLPSASSAATRTVIVELAFTGGFGWSNVIISEATTPLNVTVTAFAWPAATVDVVLPEASVLPLPSGRSLRVITNVSVPTVAGTLPLHAEFPHVMIVRVVGAPAAVTSTTADCVAGAMYAGRRFDDDPARGIAIENATCTCCADFVPDCEADGTSELPPPPHPASSAPSSAAETIFFTTGLRS